MKIHIAVAAMTLATACVVTERPVVQACRTENDSRPAPSGGELQILPSEVPGVAITSASWQVGGEKTDGAPIEYLDLVTTLRAERAVPQDEIALVYDTPGPHAVVDYDLLEKGAQSYDLDPAKPLLKAGDSITVLKGRQLQSSYYIGQNSALSYCPHTVRAVRRSALALALTPDLQTPKGQTSRLHAPHPSSPLVIVMDSALKGGLVVGVALNTADTTLKDMVVGLAYTPDTVAHTEVDSTRTADTLEYHIGDVAPHAVATFAGGWLEGGDRVIARLAYHSTDVGERMIAGARNMNRASHAPRKSAANRSGVSCRPQTSTCPE
jgi:hypothetical protein